MCLLMIAPVANAQDVDFNLEQTVLALLLRLEAAENRIKELEYDAVQSAAGEYENIGVEYEFPRVEALQGGTTNTDELVAVSTSSTNAGYLGEAYNDGVLRTGGLIDYANGIDFVTLSVDAGNVASNLNTGYVVITNIQYQKVDIFSIVTNTLLFSLENDGEGAHSVDLTPYVGGSTTGITSHVLLSNLLWTGSGHYGTANRVAAFGSDGEPTYIDYANWDTAYGWGDHDGLYIPVAYSNSPAFTNDVRAAQTNIVERDPFFVAYSNSLAFTADVRASQTNDGFEADTTYTNDLPAFTNAVQGAQTNDGYAANTDAKVGVTVGATPSYLGAAYNDGVLRTDGLSIGYDSSGTHWIILSVDTNWLSTNVINTVSNNFGIAVIEVAAVCDQNTHPYDTDDDSTGSGGGEDGGTTHPDDDSSGGSYPGGGTDEDDGTDHPSTDDCYSTVPDSIP